MIISVLLAYLAMGWIVALMCHRFGDIDDAEALAVMWVLWPVTAFAAVVFGIIRIVIAVASATILRNKLPDCSGAKTMTEKTCKHCGGKGQG